MAAQNFVVEGGLVVGSTQVFDSNGNLIGPTANSSYFSNTANLAFAQANAAFQAANNVAPQVQPSFDKANSAYVLAQAAFDAANGDLTLLAGELTSNVGFINAINSSQNTTIGIVWNIANTAYDQANTVNVLAQASFNKANTAWSYLQNGSYTATLDSTGQFVLPQITQAGLTAGYLTSAGNVGLNANGNLWKFGADGALYSPYSVQITTHGFQWPDGSYQNTAASPIAYTQGAFNQANGAYNFANTVNTYAYAAFAVANAAITAAQDSTYDQVIFNQANAAFYQANGAYNLANTTVGVDATQNTNITTAQSTATSAFLQANGAFNFANTVNTYSYAAFAAANAAMTAAQDNTYDQAIYNQANAAFYQANGAYNLANTTVGIDATQNTNITTAQSTATAAFIQANGAFNFANTVNTYAYAAFAYANTLISGGGGSPNYYQNTVPAGANAKSFWTNSDTGVMYENFGTSGSPIWAEVGPTGLLTNTAPGIISATSLYANQINVAYTPATTQNSAVQVTAANTKGGTGYADFLLVTNTSGNVTNPNKWFRVDNSGTLQILNSAYACTALSLTDTGSLTVNNNIVVPGGATVVTNSSTDKYLNIGSHGQLFDDGNFHVHTSSGSLWLNSLDGGDINLGLQTNSGSSKAVAQNISLNAGYGSTAPIYGVRAWINCGYVGSTMTTRGSGNLSVTRGAVGVYNFTFATAMPDGNYAVNATAQTPGTNSDCAVNITNGTTPNTAGFSLTVARYGNGNEDTPILHVQVVR